MVVRFLQGSPLLFHVLRLPRRPFIPGPITFAGVVSVRKFLRNKPSNVKPVITNPVIDNGIKLKSSSPNMWANKRDHSSQINIGVYSVGLVKERL